MRCSIASNLRRISSGLTEIVNTLRFKRLRMSDVPFISSESIMEIFKPPEEHEARERAMIELTTSSQRPSDVESYFSTKCLLLYKFKNTFLRNTNERSRITNCSASDLKNKEEDGIDSLLSIFSHIFSFKFAVSYLLTK